MITNYLSPLEFIITVKRLPSVEFFTQRTSVPGISVNPIEHPTPFKPTFEGGDRLNYDDLNLSFIVDEGMANYLEIFNWIKGYSFPENFGQYQNLQSSQEGLKSDISIKILNSHKNPSILIDYRDCFPISLSEVTLDTTQTDVIYPEATVTFRYNYFDITSIS
jgi:hypothetical protein